MNGVISGNMPKLTCYFAHSRQDYGSVEELEILEEMKRRRLLPYEPFLEEEKILQSYNVQNFDDNPYYELGRRLWTKCTGAIKRCDIILGWIPRRDSIGVSAELAIAYESKKFIQLIAPFPHPLYTVVPDQYFDSIQSWKNYRQYEWKNIKPY